VEKLEKHDFQRSIRLEDYISKSQAAEIFKKTSRTIQNWLDEGKFPGALKVAGQWFIPKSDINLALEIKEVVPMRQDMTKAELISALEAIIEKRDTDLACSMTLIINEVKAENLKLIEEIRRENQEIKNKLEEENSQLRKQIENSHDNLITAIMREQQQQKKSLFKRLLGK
jgi:hypothetical protein